MTLNRRPPDDVPATAATPPLLAEIETLLARQLEHVQRGQTDDAYRVGCRVTDLTAKVRDAGLVPDAATADRLNRLHRSLALALTQQMADLSEKRSRLGRHRKPVQAYRRSETLRDS